MKCVHKFVCLLFAGLLALGGCASPSGAIKNTSPVRITPALSLDFIMVEISSPLPDLATEKKSLSDLIISDLNDTGLFQNVGENTTGLTPDGGIKITAEIKQIKKVSDDARVWAGSWAGQARILVRVTVTDLKSGATVETFDTEGESGKSAWAGTTYEAIQEAASRITDEIVKINAQTSQ